MKALLPALMLLIIIAATATKPCSAQTVLLYKNAFENPITTPVANCTADLDATDVNTLWGGTGEGTGGGGAFQQINTVETMLINGPDEQYEDPSGLGGNYCLGMLLGDQTSLTFNSQQLPYINVSLLLSPINLGGCGGPWVLDSAFTRITAYDSPGGVFDIYFPGTALDADTIIGGEPGITDYTYNWAARAKSLDISASVDGNITIVLEMIRSDYTAFDSIEIASSTSPVSIKEQNNTNTLSIYPNPAKETITVNYALSNVPDKRELTITNSFGQILCHSATTTPHTVINVSRFAAGIYFLKLGDSVKMFVVE